MMKTSSSTLTSDDNVERRTGRVAVALFATDPVSRAGVAAQLAEHDITVTDDLRGRPHAAVVIADHVDSSVRQHVRQLRNAGLAGIVVVITHLDEQQLFAAVEAGASGLLRRADATPDRLAGAIRDAAAGLGVMPPELIGRLIAQLRDLHEQVLAPRGMRLAGLSEREIDVLRLVAEGFGTPDIAKKLAYSERTIKNIIQDVTTRLQLRNRSHAVAYALRHGLI